MIGLTARFPVVVGVYKPKSFTWLAYIATGAIARMSYYAMYEHLPA